MDGVVTDLKEKLDQLILQAAEVSVALDRAAGTIIGVPHYSVIENRAHELGQQLGRKVQESQIGTLNSTQDPTAKCPSCGTRCQTVRKKRSVTSIDGPLTMEEPVGYCPACRRDFFPPAGSARL
jgi:hypothetical protein